MEVAAKGAETAQRNKRSFAGGEMAEADKDEFMLAIQEAHVLPKKEQEIDT